MKKYFVISGLVFLPKVVSAHCPLCTVGAGALAVVAASIGVSTPVVGVLIGGFALAMALWVAKLVKRKYFQLQDFVVTLAVFLTTVIPIMPLIREYRPLYISLFGEYGTIFHNTYLINLYLAGALVGALLVYVAPFLSRAISQKRGKTLPYQGVSLTLLLLIIAGLIFQITI